MDLFKYSNSTNSELHKQRNRPSNLISPMLCVPVLCLQVGKLVCCGIWLVCAAIATPYFMFANTVATSSGHSCRLVWPKDQVLAYMRFWTIFQLLVGLIGPFFFISVSYLLLSRRFGMFIKWQGQSDVRRPGRRMTQTVVAVVALFLVCQTPYHAVQMVSLNRADTYSSETFRNGSQRYGEWIKLMNGWNGRMGECVRE